MSRPANFLILCFTLIETGLALRCSVAKYDLVLGKMKNMKYQMEECGATINKIREEQGKSKGEITVELSCFSAILAPDVIFKGCFLKGGCKLFHKNFQNMAHTSDPVPCTECSEDECNSVDSENLSAKSDILDTSASQRRVVCLSVLVLTGAALMLEVFGT